MPRKNQKNKEQKLADLKDPDYERLGRMLVDVYEFGFINKKRLFFMNLFRGIAVGLGSVIGATIVVALVLWVLSLFDFVPLVGPLQDSIQETVQQDS